MHKRSWKILRPIVRFWIAISGIAAPVLFFVFAEIALQLVLFWRGGMTILEVARTPEWFALGFAFPVVYIAIFAWWFNRKRKGLVRISPKTIRGITEKLDETLKDNLQPLERSIQELINEIRQERNERNKKTKQQS